MTATSSSLLKTCEIHHASISIDSERHRALRPELIDTLAASIKATGRVLHPIAVRPGKNSGRFVLIAGRHRLEACRKLGWNRVPCIIIRGLSAIAAEELELRENIDRGELSPAESTLHLARLKAIAEERHKRKAGRPSIADDKINACQVGKDSSVASSSAKAVATDTGVSPRQVDRAATRAAKVPRMTEIIGTALDKGTEIDALAAMAPASQDAIIDKAKARDPKVSAVAEGKKAAAKAAPLPWEPPPKPIVFDTLLFDVIEPLLDKYGVAEMLACIEHYRAKSAEPTK